ncbi:phage tail tape measure protein [Kribbella deserti]|uniref:Phage tail tape measure protein n=1 Tax=Kribbella deserti TaxID=1926257 RepID=A0ABV6QGQ4_9ACTN
MAAANAAVRIGLLADASTARKEIATVPKAAEDAVSETESKWGKLGGVLAGVGVGAGTALSGALLGALDVQDATATLNAQLGLTGPASAKVGKAAGDLYKNAYGESVAETGDAIKAAFQNGLVSINDSEKAIEDVGASVLNYAKITGEDAVSSTRAVGQMLKTNMAPNAKAAFDILTRGQQLGLNKSEDLLDTFNEYSTQFRKLGVDGTQALGLIQQGLQGGARDSDLVADALKEFSIRAVDGSKTSADAFKALGLSATEMTATFAKGGPGAAKGLDTVLDRLRSVKDPAKQAQIAVGLFGTQAEDLGAALFKLDPSTATKGLGQVAGAADQVNKTLGDTAKSKITAFTRTLKMGLVDFLGNKVVPALSKALPAVMAFVSGMQDGTGPGGQLAAVLKTLAAVIAPLVVLLGKLAGFVLQNKDFFAPFAAILGTVVAAVKAWTVAQLALNIVLTANPVGILVVAIAALVAGLVWAFKNSDRFRSGLLATWSAVKTGVLAAVNAVVAAVKGVGAFFSGFGQGVASAFSSVLSFFRDLPGKIARAVGNAASWLFDKGRAVLVGFAKGYVSYWATIGRFYLSIGSAILRWVGNVTKLLYTKGRQIIVSLANGYLSFWTTIGRFFAGIGSAVLKWVGNTAALLYTKGRQIILSLANGYLSYWANVAAFFRGIASAVVKWVGNTASLLYTKGRQIILSLATGYVSYWANVASFFRGIGSSVLRWVGNVGSTLYNAGRSIISGLINGISSKVGDLKNYLGNVTGWIQSWKGPLPKDKRLLTPAGSAILLSLIKGMDGETDRLKRFLGGVTSDIENGISASPSVALSASLAGGGGGSASAPAPVINVYALTSGPEVGRQVVQAITDYERANGSRWRH